MVTLIKLESRSALFHRDCKIRAFPAILCGPEESKNHLASRRQRCGGQMKGVDAEAGVAGIGVVGRVPVVDAPAYASGREQGDAQDLVARDGADFIIKPPAAVWAAMFINQIALYGLRRLGENLVVPHRGGHFVVLGVGPDEGAGGAGGLAAKEFECRNVGSVPDLLRKQAAVPYGGVFHDGQECFRLIAMAARQCIVCALSSEQRPRAADARAVEG